MIDRLIEFILNIVDIFFFAKIVNDYEEGVMLRFGKFNRILLPGFHWRIPFKIEDPIVTSVVPDVSRLPTQVFTLQDGTDIAATAVLTYKVHNVKKALLEVEDAETSLHDAVSGTIRRLMTPHSFEDLQSPEKCAEIEMAVAKDIRSDAFKWGFEVIRVQFPDLVRLNGAYKLFGDGSDS